MKVIPENQYLTVFFLREGVQVGFTMQLTFGSLAGYLKSTTVYSQKVFSSLLNVCKCTQNSQVTYCMLPLNFLHLSSPTAPQKHCKKQSINLHFTIIQYSKMATNKSFFCLHVNISPLCLVNMYKKKKNFDVKMRKRGLINLQTKE